MLRYTLNFLKPNSTLTLRKPFCYQHFNLVPTRNMSSNTTEKEYKKIEINEKDLEWQQVRGSGPGGQATNKTNNCAVLTHKPTGIVVKCHSTRDLETNKHLAIKSLKEKLDVMINGNLSKKAKKMEKAKKQKDRRRRRSEEKHGSKEENATSPVEDESD